MEIIKTENINTVLPLHNEIFHMDFPLDSYYKKLKKYPLHIFVYKENEKDIGYSIIIEENDKKNLYAWYGGVLPEYQGKGITKNFFNFLISFASNLDFESVTVATNNKRPHMIVLATKLGFNIYDLKKRNPIEDNKIYFKYSIDRNESVTLSLAHVTFAQIEQFIVSSYKKNNQEISFYYDDSNYLKLKYIIDYCQSFAIPPQILLYIDECRSFSDEERMTFQNYSGKIKLLKKEL